MDKSQVVTEGPTMERLAALAGVQDHGLASAAGERSRATGSARPDCEDCPRVRLSHERRGAASRTRRTQTIAVVIEQAVSDERPMADPLLLWMIGGLIEVLTPEDHALLLTTSGHLWPPMPSAPMLTEDQQISWNGA